jgi:hypothetical protein
MQAWFAAHPTVHWRDALVFVAVAFGAELVAAGRAATAAAVPAAASGAMKCSHCGAKRTLLALSGDVIVINSDNSDDGTHGLVGTIVAECGGISTLETDSQLASNINRRRLGIPSSEKGKHIVGTPCSLS